MRCRSIPQLLAALLGYWSSGGIAAPAAYLDIDAKISEQAGLSATINIAGQIEIHSTGEPFNCIYLPFSDPNFFENRVSFRHFDQFIGTKGDRTQGELSSSIDGFEADPNHPYLVHLPQATTKIKLRFESRLKLPVIRRPNDILLDGFHPIPSKSCTPTGEILRENARISAKLSTSARWQLAGPNIARNSDFTNFSVESTHLAIFMLRNYQQLVDDSQSPTIRVHYQSPEFPQVLGSIRAAIAANQSWFSPYPYGDLTVIETSQLQTPGLPAIVTVNRPQQEAFQKIQYSWLNWTHWITISAVSSQWFGTWIKPASKNDFWVANGFIDYITHEAIARVPNRNNIFNSLDHRLPVRLNYRQFQDINAHSLKKVAPYLKLTNEQLVSTSPFDKQPPLQFIRFAILLRQLRFVAGEQAFKSHLSFFAKRATSNPLSAQGFVDSFADSNSPLPAETRNRLVRLLKQWLTQPDWPDLKLEPFESQQLDDGTFTTALTAKQISGFDVYADLKVSLAAGIQKPAHLESTSSVASAELITNSEIRSVELDPDRHSYDADRFNNTNRLPRIEFFPGTVDTLPDDAILVAWLPYAKRLPGDPWMLGLHSNIVKYLNSGVDITLERSPENQKSEYSLSWQSAASGSPTAYAAKLRKRLDGRLTLEAALTRGPISFAAVTASGTLALRQRSVLGLTSTKKYSASARGTARYSASRCIIGGDAEHEVGIPDDQVAPFQRDIALLFSRCRPFGAVGTAIRAFSGRLKAPDSSAAEQTLLFRITDTEEANIRLDSGNLSPVDSILSINLDLDFPLSPTAFGQSFFVSNRIRGRLFIDRGFAETRDNETLTLTSAGTGVTIPFGGDLAGIGALTFTQASLLVANYRQVNDEISKSPSLLFDLTGSL
jgi:hypothetical protein